MKNILPIFFIIFSLNSFAVDKTKIVRPSLQFIDKKEIKDCDISCCGGNAKNAVMNIKKKTTLRNTGLPIKPSQE